MRNSPLDHYPKTMTINSVIYKMIAELVITFYPSFGYIFQVNKFKRKKSSRGFSKYICLILLISNILRIYYWVGKQYSISLLYQSVVVIVCQLFIMHYYIRYRDLPENVIFPEKTIIQHLTNWKETLNFKYLWKWPYEIEYYKFISFFLLIISILSSTIGAKTTKFFKWMGNISFYLEIFSEIPQIIESHELKNTENVSFIMIIMWLLGDLIKTGYNLKYKCPKTIIIGGIIQNFEDIFLTMQIIIYDDSLRAIFRKKNKNNNNGNGNINNQMNSKIDFEMENKPLDNENN